MKTYNVKENYSDNLGHNILRRFDVCANFSFTTTETNRDH